ncbi:hypothetical protein ACFWMG_23845 [Streptomyces sp. NPDC127074]|uniref:hypothetical protein n=1 Tax=Streptomyces sp. NPDC127074 TaxID=3347130 RepID=UPI00365A2776
MVLCRPLGRLFLADDSGVPRPTVLFHGGYDSTLEESHEGALSLFHQRTFDWLDTLLTG